MKATASLFQKILWFSLILVLTGVGTLFFWTRYFQESVTSANASLPIYGNVPKFSLLERGGQTIKDSDLLGKMWVVDFIFTRCQGQCPFMTQKMAELKKVLPSDENLKWVSISVEPSWDTPQNLSKYAKDHEADFGDWFFLTGEKEEIFSLIRNGFLLGVEEESGSITEPIIHSNRFILVDRELKIRGMYPATDEEALKKLRQDVMSLMKEMS